jgi:hypothetical protein
MCSHSVQLCALVVRLDLPYRTDHSVLCAPTPCTPSRSTCIYAADHASSVSPSVAPDYACPNTTSLAFPHGHPHRRPGLAMTTDWHNHYRLDRTRRRSAGEPTPSAACWRRCGCAAVRPRRPRARRRPCTPGTWRSCPPTCSVVRLAMTGVLSDADVPLLATTAWTACSRPPERARPGRVRTAAGGLSSTRTAALTANSVLPSGH